MAEAIFGNLQASGRRGRPTLGEGSCDIRRTGRRTYRRKTLEGPVEGVELQNGELGIEWGSTSSSRPIDVVQTIALMWLNQLLAHNVRLQFPAHFFSFHFFYRSSSALNHWSSTQILLDHWATSL